jgi:putative intracellular protease/amidase
MPRKILTLLSEYGYWGEELVGPLAHFDKAGYETVFATPTGKRAHALPPSFDEDYVDPPLGRTVTSAEVADAVRTLDASGRLDAPLSLAEWVPTRPYTSAPAYLRELEAYNRALDRLFRQIRGYDALLIVGGSGPIVDLANNERVHALILAFLRADKLIGAECYGAGFLGTDFVIGPPPYPLEYILRDATAPGGRYHGNFGHEGSVIVDWPFVTGRSNNDSFLTGQKMVEALEDGLVRYGW